MVAQQCPVCDQPATTKEHIVPQWLQKLFDLKDQPFGLNNGTTVLYHQATIPICQTCNNDRLAGLEEKICNNAGHANDYFLWALKIQYFMAIKDSRLPYDRANPAKGSVIPARHSQFGIRFIKNALMNCGNTDFSFNPNPFGSVFIIQNPDNRKDFGWIDLPYPYWAFFISLPGNRTLAVLFRDRGMVKQSLSGSVDFETHFHHSSISNNMDGMRALALILCMRQHRIANIPSTFTLNPGGITSVPPKELRYKTQVDDAFVAKLLQRLSIQYR